MSGFLVDLQLYNIERLCSKCIRDSDFDFIIVGYNTVGNMNTTKPLNKSEI